MEKQIIEIISEILHLDEDMLKERMDDHTVWDSLQRVEILFAVEDEFDVQFTQDEIAEMATPEMLKEAVLRKVDSL